MSVLSLVVLRAENPRQLAEFYAGLGMSFIEEQHGNGPVHHASRVGHTVFEIYPAGEKEERTTGTRIGFQVPSIEQAITACSARVLGHPKMTAWGRRAVIQDPEGHKVELVEAAVESEPASQAL